MVMYVIEKLKHKIRYGTAIPALAMLIIAALVVVIYYFTIRDTREAKSLEVGDSLQLVASVDTSIEGIEWRTSDVNIATVESDGTIKGISPGEVEIKLVIDGETIDKYRVIVYDYNDETEKKYIAIKNLKITPNNSNITVGEKVLLSVNIDPEDATNKTLKWESSDQNIVTVNQTGEVTAISEGTATISVKSTNNVVAKATVKVKKSNKKPTPTATPNSSTSTTEITINQGMTGSFRPGATKQLTASASDVTWKSSNTKVATVDANGLVTMNVNGIAIISATTTNGLKALYIVSINKYIPAELTVPVEKISLTAGNSNQLNAENNTGTKIAYSSSNTRVATVSDDGTVNAHSTGNATITVSSDEIVKKVEVSVKGYRIHFIDIDGPGDAILLEANGKYAMIDSGTSTAQSKVKNYLDKFNIKQLEFMVITHPHVDHNGAVNYLLNNGIKINTIYQKEYTNKDLTAYSGSASTKNRVNSIIDNATNRGTQIVYVDKTFNDGQAVDLEGMKVYFFNTTQRLVTESNGTEGFDYYSSQNWANQSENLNSISNLIVANNHSLLTTGDLNEYNILSSVLLKVNAIAPNLDVYKISHHGYFNCTGKAYMTVNANRYIVTNTIDDKLGDGNYSITNDIVNNNGNQLTSCFAYMSLNMCDAYYSADSSNGIIVNFSNNRASFSGGGYGRNNSNRCN